MALVQTMVAARWRLLRMWGIQTTGFELEMARARQNADPAAPSSGAVLAAVAFRALADSSRVLALQLCLEAQRVRRTPSRASGTVLCRTPFCACSSEAASDRQYNDRQYNDREYSHALAMLLKLRATPDSNAPSDPPLNLTTETWDDDFQTEPNSEPHSQPDPPIETMRYRRSPRRPLTSREPNFHACEADLRPASSMSQPAKHGNWRASSEQGICGAGPRPAIAGWKPAPLGRLSRVEQELANVPPSQSETAPRQATVTNRNSKSSGSPLLCYPTNSCSPPVIITRIITATP
jgi:hypothetical protein